MSTLSINSSNSSHSASDFDNHSPYISDSTLSSTPSSPSVKSSTCPTLRPKRIVLPSAVFASAAFLHDLAATLDKGAGDLVVLCLGYWNNGENTEENSKPSMRFPALAKEAGLDFENYDMEWQVITVTIDGKEVPYFVSEKSADFESHSINIDDDKRVIKSVDGVLADYKSEFEDQPQSNHTHGELLTLFSFASFRCIITTELQGRKLYTLERPAFSFPPLISYPTTLTQITTPSDVVIPNTSITPFGVPTLSEWRDLWAAWDLVTLEMIPPTMLHQKPIDLRHKCLFYIGHIPTFLDMLMSKALGESNTEPKNFMVIFERGIDPHVDEPDHCHSHSEVPEADEDWPTLEDILGFRDRVRERLVRLYDHLESGKRTINRRVARMLVMTFEHEGFHVETLLYMLIQRTGSGTVSPPGFTSPLWSSLAKQWTQQTPPLSSTTTILGPTTIILGHYDSEADDLLPEFMHDFEGHNFGWDNESPPRALWIDKFKIDWRPISNADFYKFWTGEGRGKVDMPKSWIGEDDDVRVLTLYGPVPMEIAKDWPVLTSYDDLVLYARHKGGRIPTEPELRLFFDTHEVGHGAGANVGFRNWHPIPATTGGAADSGHGSNGGAWEWTSTAFAGHDGLVPTDHFTGYSTDFFDSKHQVVLGASYVTIPRLASRRTLRNFYQHNYPYPWVGARVAYDL